MKLILCFIMVLFFACDDGGTLDFGSQGIMIVDYGIGTPCGGSVMNYNGMVYRTYNGGAAPIDNNLQFLVEEKLGDYSNSGDIYHAEVINGNLWFSVVTYDGLNDFIKVVNSEGQEINSYEVGLYPGDFVSWNNSHVFVANEGAYGASNGSISMITQMGQIITYQNIGDVVQSVEVYNDKLIVIINNDHKIKIFDINSEGLQLPGIEVDTGSSSPREMVIVDGKIYFTNWDTKDIKVLNLFTYQIENSVSVSGLPEDIITDGQNLYVSIPNIEKYDQNLGSEVIKLNMGTLDIEHIYDVGLGPEYLSFSDNGNLYVSRKTYSEDWYTAYHGTSKIVTP